MEGETRKTERKKYIRKEIETTNMSFKRLIIFLFLSYIIICGRKEIKRRKLELKTKDKYPVVKLFVLNDTIHLASFK